VKAMAGASASDVQQLLCESPAHEMEGGSAREPSTEGARASLKRAWMRPAIAVIFSLVVLAVVLAGGSRGGSTSTAVVFGATGVAGFSEKNEECSSASDNCMESGCCRDAGYTCFTKNEHWANCNKTCSRGINLQDPKEHQTPWSCDVIGEKGHLMCGSATENCMGSKCCKNPGFTCFEKNEHWANCNDTCTAGINHLDPEEHKTPWSCKVLGSTAGDPGNPNPERCTEHHSTYPTRISCMGDPDARGHYAPVKKLWSCDCDTGCQAPHPDLCTQCGSHIGTNCYQALTWYCCDDEDFTYHWS